MYGVLGAREDVLRVEYKIGDRMKIPADQRIHPEVGHAGKIVWISEDEKAVAITCEKKHDQKTTVVMVKINSDQ